jgi:hypothetical protein
MAELSKPFFWWRIKEGEKENLKSAHCGVVGNRDHGLLGVGALPLFLFSVQDLQGS